MSSIQPVSNSPLWLQEPPQPVSGELITPEEQLQRLIPRIDREVSSILPPNIADIIAEYALDPVLTNWHKAYTELKHTHLFSEQIPSLPDDIQATLHEWRQKGLTPLLYFIPGGSINQLLNALGTYWEQKHPGVPNPLRFRYIWDRARAQYGGDVQVEPHWVVISDDVIPGSRSKTFDQQVTLMNALNLECEIPSLYSVVATMFLHKIATNERLYQAGNDQNGDRWTYTRLREIVDNWHLVVGGFAPSGVHVHYSGCDYGYEFFGVVALRKC